MVDALGNRMKSFYEDRFRYKLPRRSFTVIRIDGKAFHTFTKGLKKPFDGGLMEDMDQTAVYLCKNIQGAKLAYVQSDEISLVLTDFDDLDTAAWFDGNIQKMASIAASLATAKFNQLRMSRSTWEGYDIPGHLDQDDIDKFKLAMFDARVFQIPYIEEVINYLVWRQQDATRNSIQSVAQSLYSHSELSGKKQNDLQEMIFQNGSNWNNYTSGEKRGRLIQKVEKKYLRRGSEVTLIENEDELDIKISELNVYSRSVWEVNQETQIFSKEKDYLKDIIIPKPRSNGKEDVKES
jgi:tRNA(His) 5'-end guanylyltransferase